MNVCVFGLWHLGTVTAACLASADHNVTGLDFDPAVVADLSRGVPPLFEPDLENLVKAGIASGRLRFTSDATAALQDADVVWLTIDTPVDEDDRANTDLVILETARLFPRVKHDALMLISSQLPVGTTRRLERMFEGEAAGRALRFAYLPENLRLGNAIATFTRSDRIVVGARSPDDHAEIEALLAPFTERFEWMSVESAEMTKHALNAFLASSVSFINEIAALCEQVGADAAEVARGLKSDARIGPRAYLSPGGPFAGGTLARDVSFLSSLGNAKDVPTHLIDAIRSSNDAHRRWPARQLSRRLQSLAGRTIALWGLTYKPGTDTLRRSTAVELGEWLHSQGAVVQAHDPAVHSLPESLARTIRLTDDPLAALINADALVIATSWPDYRTLDADDVARAMTQGIVLDANGFLADMLAGRADLTYVRVGRSHS